MFSAASKTLFTLAAACLVVGYGYGVATGDRSALTVLASTGLLAAALGVAAFWIVPGEPILPARGAPEGEADEPATLYADATDVPTPSAWPLVGGVALSLVGVGAALGYRLIVVGVVASLVAMFGWLGQAWREHPSWTPAMSQRVNDRFVTPIALPGTIVVFAGAGVIAISRLLLSIESALATAVVGAVVAFAILGAGYALAATPNLGRRAIAGLVAVSSGVVVAAGVAGAMMGEREFHAEEHPGALRLVADDLAFSTDTLDLPEGRVVKVELENQDTVPHSLVIVAADVTPVFNGDVIPAHAALTYELGPLTAGTYVFYCGVHPEQMRGTVEVGEETEPSSDVVEEGER